MNDEFCKVTRKKWIMRNKVCDCEKVFLIVNFCLHCKGNFFAG